MDAASSWSRGYPIREAYPPAWHGFQSPAHLRLVCALMGVAWDVGPDTPLSIAEVGCGTGYTAQLLAASNPHWQVLGLDYNPAHVAEARSMVAEAGLGNARFIDADLAELSDADVDALPEFDLVTVHGVWSWVADPVREGVLRLLRRRLKPGGLVFMGYNALPGASGALGLARLVRQSMLSGASSAECVADASRRVIELLAAEPAHLPQSGWRKLLTGEVKGARLGYLLHEFETEHWRPCFHADVAAALAGARCEYVGSATIDENFPAMSLSPAQQAVWSSAPDSATRELLFDMCVPRAFRRDVFVRGKRPVAAQGAVDKLWLAASTLDTAVPKLHTQAGEAELPGPIAKAVLSALAQRPHRIGELCRLPGCEKVAPGELAALLVGARCAVALWHEPGGASDLSEALATSRRFNAMAATRLAPYGVGGGQLGVAVPALGGGLTASPLELAAANLSALWWQERAGAGAGQAQQAPEVDWLIGRLIPPDAAPPEEVLAGLRAALVGLLRDRWPVWKALGALGH